MRISTTSSRRSRTSALLATAASLSLVLTACTIGEAEDAVDAAAPVAETSEAEQAEPEQTTEPEADRDDEDIPDTPVDALVLNADDAPELGLVPFSFDDIPGGVDTLSTLTDDLVVDPPECIELNDDDLLERAEPGVTAIQTSETFTGELVVTVSRNTDGIPSRASEIENCPTMTVTMPFDGAAGIDPVEASIVTTNTLLDVEAPEGVQHFSAMEQETTTDVMGSPFHHTTLMFTGMVRGIGVSVMVDVEDESESGQAADIGLDTFIQQAAKIRDA